MQDMTKCEQISSIDKKKIRNINALKSPESIRITFSTTGLIEVLHLHQQSTTTLNVLTVKVKTWGLPIS